MNRFRGAFLSVAVLEAHLQDNSLKGLDDNSVQGKKHRLQIPPEGLGWTDAMTTSTQMLVTTQAPSQVTAFQDDDYSSALHLARTLPVALFWHDNLLKLEQQICEQYLRKADPELQAGVVGIGIAIALICQEQANPQNLIPQLLTHKPLAGTLIHTQLSQVQALLTTHASLTTVWNQVSQSYTPQRLASAMAIAFYCWSSTADSYSLTLSRLLTLPQPSVVAALIISVLSGVFNSISGIPLSWQTPLFVSSAADARQNILMSADQLLAAWSGYYCQEGMPTPPQLEQIAVSAPGVLRPRQ